MTLATATHMFANHDHVDEYMEYMGRVQLQRKKECGKKKEKAHACLLRRNAPRHSAFGRLDYPAGHEVCRRRAGLIPPSYLHLHTEYVLETPSTPYLRVWLGWTCKPNATGRLDVLQQD